MSHETAAILCGILIIAVPLALFGLSGLVSAIFNAICDRQERRLAKRAPSYLRAYDRKGNRIK